MPSERFFYRPPDPGYASFGAGIGQGISNAVGGYLDERDRREEKERQALEDQRRREREDAAAEYERAMMELKFAELGGGLGKPPTPEYARLDFGGMGMAGMEGANPLTKPVRLGPEGPAGPVARAAADPNFRQYKTIGDIGYIEDIDSRERRRAQEEAQLAAYQGQLRTGTAAEALMATRGIPEREAYGAANLMETGFADYGDLYPDRWYPRTQQEAQDQYLFEQRNRAFAPRATGGGGTSARRLPTYDQAYEFLKEQYPGEYEGESSLSPQELHEMALAMANGEDVSLAGGGPAGIPPGSPFAPMDFEQYFGQFGRGGRSEPDYTAPMSDAEIEDIRASLIEARIPRNKWEEKLVAEGVGEKNIDRILGR